ncbi:TIGR00255 family protein, putative [Babesia ovata]|uniref:TIGR00255 family protein, putative n=1 Tax=Babesia ovata TaxID=189622 RepID=A0A2H6KGT4_9APIC|nr:TIGR00255 family protein, putative [Babesia ovata]GBE62179.1 TIGR00255 family protein, putative [Babesia ovata]
MLTYDLRCASGSDSPCSLHRDSAERAGEREPSRRNRFVMHKEYYKVLEQLEELSPEEMLSELIAQTNTLEALKAELGAEELVGV